MGMVIRRLDNPLVDAFVNRIRCLHGNRVIHKDDFARGLIASMRAGETVGILMDTNMTPPQGVFVPFFGVEACTASGMARVALKTGAAVVPGFLLWEESERKYVLRFGEELEVVHTRRCGGGCGDEYGALRRRLKSMFGGILSSGCGCIGGGRRGRRAKRGSIDGEDKRGCGVGWAWRLRCVDGEIARVSGIEGATAGCGGVCDGCGDAGEGAGVGGWGDSGEPEAGADGSCRWIRGCCGWRMRGMRLRWWRRG